MKKVKDNFSFQSDSYKKFRPVYPHELYCEILRFVNQKKVCWDCGTGNGQVANELSAYFEKVYATDISRQQISNAVKQDNIIYKIERAEKTGFKDNTFDLITVGQAVHWFDFKAFNQEVKRVLKPNGIIAIWGYGLLRITPDIDKIIDQFYLEKIGKYWNKERSHIDQHYKTIDFDFTELDIKQQFSIQTKWDINHLEGYLRSWSAVQHYIIENAGTDPVNDVIKAIKKLWKEDTNREVKFPVFLRAGKVVK